MDNVEILEVLRKCEWAGWIEGNLFAHCPVCGAPEYVPDRAGDCAKGAHEPGCKLAALIQSFEESAKAKIVTTA